jgi:phosphoglycolate phosphatase
MATKTPRDELASTGPVLPGAHDTLRALDADPLVHQAVLSGNLRAVSRIKLEVFSLDQCLDLASSAYGDDHHDRAGSAHVRADTKRIGLVVSVLRWGF